VIGERPFRSIPTNHSNDTQYGFCIAYRIFCKVDYILTALILVTMVLTSCTESPTPYRPPWPAFQNTQPVQVNPTPLSTMQVIDTPLPTATEACADNLTFLEAVSIPDGMVVHPGEHLDKCWLVQNSGSCNWDDHYRLRSITGTNLNAPHELALYPARSGAKVILRVELTAPTDPGSYQNTWQAYDPQGVPFGDPLNIQIVVNSGQP
jgi:Ig-like domain from next to BRCA1 gene